MGRRFINQSKPMVSCLCVTRHGVSHLRNAIDCFQGQSYSNRELIIVYQGNNRRIINFIHSKLSDPRIKLVVVPVAPKLSLGELRNISIEKASGDYFCTWDDDDWHHGDRLKIQIDCALASNNTASILNYIFIYDKLRKRAYFSKHRLWEGSLLCKRNIYPSVKYPHQSKSEDSLFVYQIIRKNRVFPIVYPGLYIYVFHGKNTWNLEFFQKIFDSSQKLSSKCSNLVSEILKGKYEIEEASRILHSATILNEINYHYSTKRFLLQQDAAKEKMTKNQMPRK